jgi:hypothetical protein
MDGFGHQMGKTHQHMGFKRGVSLNLNNGGVKKMV